LVWLLSYDKLSRKPLLFKSFTGLSVQEFDDIYNEQITKKYTKHEIRRLSKGKERKRDIGQADLSS
jgi:DNA-binding transcriptional regulator WhiA